MLRKGKSIASKYRGVWLCKRSNKWKAEIRSDKRRYCLGTFTTEENAFKAYRSMFKKLHGYSYEHIDPIIDEVNNIVKIPLSMKQSILLHGKFYAIIDFDDYSKVQNISFRIKSDGYVQATINGKSVSLHRIVMNYPRLHVDHINGNKLDNRKSNLRLVTQAQNNCNCSKRLNCLSIYKGVTFHKRNNKWQAQIVKNKKNHHLGYFKSEVNAAQAYNFAAEKYHGEFAKYNTYQQ